MKHKTSVSREKPKIITQRRRIGNLGEGIACRYLRKKGFDIIGRNYQKKWGEIDIVAKKDKKIHFVEVKSVSRERIEGKSGHRPENNIHKWKLQRISKTIQTYLWERNYDEKTEWKFDIITVYLDFRKRIGRVCMLSDIIL